jgi:hypothetical protein
VCTSAGRSRVAAGSPLGGTIAAAHQALPLGQAAWRQRIECLGPEQPAAAGCVLSAVWLVVGRAGARRATARRRCPVVAVSLEPRLARCGACLSRRAACAQRGRCASNGGASQAMIRTVLARWVHVSSRCAALLEPPPTHHSCGCADTSSCVGRAVYCSRQLAPTAPASSLTRCTSPRVAPGPQMTTTKVLQCTRCPTAAACFSAAHSRCRLPMHCPQRKYRNGGRSMAAAASG